MTQVIAIDWPGRKKGAAEAIWLGRVVDGKIIDLENGRDRQAVIDKAIELAGRDLDTVVGLDFAFGFPAWYSKRRGWTSGRAVWEAMREHADVLIEACEPPFWGRPGTKAQQLGDPYRETEKALATRPKSVFQIGGAGAVGTGSLRGMRHLLDFSDAASPSGPSTIPVGRSSSRSTRGCSRTASSRAGTGVGATTWPPVSPISPNRFESEPRARRTASTPRSPR
ncbi:MAG: hypothetical protein WKF33_11460 [Thermoleophilaceae bacterium]